MPTEVVGKYKDSLKDKYVGESKKQLRHGYGVYKYDNKFFRYEGQWKEGLKHGHGKLILGDGGYYEGTFVRGEMQGHGYRVYGLSGTTYSGQFDNGVMHGQGLLKKTNGEQYEGSWTYGKKEGEGILTDTNGGVYEGEFHDNKRHGDGRQIYSNGDQYEGDWVLGKRHGAGLLRCGDGTLYDGQWRGDVYHGEGSISHASGVEYKGMWVNGRPECEAVRLRLSGEAALNEVFIVEQGKPFSLCFECVGDSGELMILENGRSFKVSGSMKKVVRSKSRMSLLASPPKEKTNTITTPFGYSVEPYDLLQVPCVTDTPTPNATPSTPNQTSHFNEGEDSKPRMVTFDTEMSPDRAGDGSGLKSLEEEVDPQSTMPSATTNEKPNDELSALSSTNIETSTSKPSHGLGIKHSESLLAPSSFGLSSQETRSLLMGKELGTVSSEETKVKKKDEDFLANLIQPFPTQIMSGVGAFSELYIPPPPLPDISHIIPPSISKGASSLSLPGENNATDIARESSGNLTMKSPSKSPKIGRQVSSPARMSKSPRASPSQSQRKLATVTESKKSSEKLRAEKEKLLQPKREKFALPGTYVLIISEITNPPFLDSHLPDLHVEVKIVSPKSPREQSMEKLMRSKTKLKAVSRLKHNIADK